MGGHNFGHSLKTLDCHEVKSAAKQWKRLAEMVSTEGVESGLGRRFNNIERGRGHVLQSIRCRAVRTARKRHGDDVCNRLLTTPSSSVRSREQSITDVLH